MRKHITRLLTTLLALVMLLPIVVQATPVDGWTDEAEQAYQTVTQLVIQRVTESKDYLATATQEENTKAVYALWTSGATVPGGFYDEYLQALADWLDLAVKRGKTAYIPGAIRTVAAMGLDVTDFAGHDLMDALRKPELVEADEDRLDMLMDLDAAGAAGKTDEFNALREQLLTETLARQQSSGEFRYTSKWPAELKRKGVAAEPDRFDYILLTAKSAQALAPYRSRKDVSAAIDKALNYLSEQQLPSGGFLKYGAEDVEEDAAVLEMLAALGISPDDGRFVKNGHTVLDGMMGWYQGKYSSSAPAPGQGFYRENANWGYNTYYKPLGWVKSSWGSMYDPDDPDNPDKCVIERKYINEAAFSGFSLFYTASQTRNTSTEDLVVPPRSDTDVKLDYKQLLKQKTDGMVERVIANYEYLLTEAREITAREIAGYSSQILALQNANAELTKAEKEKLQEIMTVMVGASGDYYLGRTSSTYSAGAVRAMQYLGMDPANVNGLDYLAVLANTGKLEATSTYDFNSYLRDIESVSAQVWRSRGIDVGHVRQLHGDGRVGVILLCQPVQQRLQLLRRVQRRVLLAEVQRRLLLVLHGHGQLYLVAVFHVQRPYHLIVGAGGVRPQPPVQQRRGILRLHLRLPQRHPSHALRRVDGHLPAVQQGDKVPLHVLLGHGVLRYDGGRAVHTGAVVGGDQLGVVTHRLGTPLRRGRHGREHMVLPPVRAGVVGLAGRQIGVHGRVRGGGRLRIRRRQLRPAGQQQKQRRGKARRQQVKAAVRADKQREQAEKSGNRTRRTFDRGGR